MTISEKIMAILNEPATSRINFRYVGVHIYGAGYARLAGAVQSGDIPVRLVEDPRAGILMHRAGVAVYNSRSNIFYIPGSDFLAQNRLHEKAIVVHEMTHALMDYHYRQQPHLLVVQSEAIAYIAQMMYVHSHGIDNADRFFGFSSQGTADEMNVLQLAWNIAHHLLTTPGGYEVDRSAGVSLERAIESCGLYRQAAQRHQEAEYDGIPLSAH